MKKLKIYGGKRRQADRVIKGIISYVYVKDNRVVVESKQAKIREKLQAELDRVAYSGAFSIGRHKEIRDRKGQLIEHQAIELPQKPGDPEFLDAVKNAIWFWDNKRFGGYEIDPLSSKVVED